MILKTFVFYHEMARQLTVYRKVNTWIGEGGMAAQQQTLQNLERALKDCFPNVKNRKGFPRFKKVSDRKDRITVPAVSVTYTKLTDGTITHLRLPNLPLIRVRNIQVPNGSRMTNVTIAMDGDGWSVSLGMIAPRPEACQPTVNSLGVDMGLTTLATAASEDLSLVMEIDNPRPLKNALKRLRRSNRKMSRRTKGSVGHKRAARELARRHRKVADLRRGHHHRATRMIVDAAAHISVETLSVKAMMKTRLARSVADAAPGGFLRMLKYKAEWADRGFSDLGRFERSTGCCPDCDTIGPRLALSQRSWTCENCGIQHERDLAAARWIDKVGRRSPEPGTALPPPKRGIAVIGKERPTRSARRGPPANIPGTRESARGSTG